MPQTAPERTPKAQSSAAAQALARQLEKGATGKLCMGGAANAPRLVVCVHNGYVLAAESQDDSIRYLRRLHHEGALPEEALADLRERLDRDEPVFGQLLVRVGEDLLDRVLRDRFLDNLAAFLGSDETPWFQPAEAVFVDNLQLGFDPLETIGECAAMWNAAAALPSTMVLVAGRTSSRTELEARIVATLAEGRTIGQVLDLLPIEPIAGRARIAKMLVAHVLRPSLESEPRMDSKPPEVSRASTQGRIETPVSDVGDVDDVLEDQETSEIALDGIDDELPSMTTPAPEAHNPDPVSRTPSRPLGKRQPTGELAPLTNWLSQGLDAAEEDLDAFSDHDEVRGGNEKGTFKTEQHNLDRVEVTHIDHDEVIAAEEAPLARYSAPALTDDEAFEKIEVANDVLGAIVATYDGERGRGGGQAAVQLLLDGPPARFAALFQGIATSEAGRLPKQQVLQNLHQRPATEHRRMLSDGLVDLIERALSLAADELEGDSVDAMLERVAGYRQRIGP